MKKYNIKNYIRYKEDVKQAINTIPVRDFIDYTPAELKIIFFHFLYLKDLFLFLAVRSYFYVLFYLNTLTI